MLMISGMQRGDGKTIHNDFRGIGVFCRKLTPEAGELRICGATLANNGSIPSSIVVLAVESVSIFRFTLLVNRTNQIYNHVWLGGRRQSSLHSGIVDIEERLIDGSSLVYF